MVGYFRGTGWAGRQEDSLKRDHRHRRERRWVMTDTLRTGPAPARATFVLETIEELMEDLKTELAKTPGDAEQICELSRGLDDEADHAYSHPEIWDDERMYGAAVDLLQKAAEATVGTEYEESCALRKVEFIHRIETARQARQAMLPFRNTLSA